jgi:hypothetical protein
MQVWRLPPGLERLELQSLALEGPWAAPTQPSPAPWGTDGCGSTGGPGGPPADSPGPLPRLRALRLLSCHVAAPLAGGRPGGGDATVGPRLAQQQGEQGQRGQQQEQQRKQQQGEEQRGKQPGREQREEPAIGGLQADGPACPRLRGEGGGHAQAATSEPGAAAQHHAPIATAQPKADVPSASGPSLGPFAVPGSRELRLLELAGCISTQHSSSASSPSRPSPSASAGAGTPLQGGSRQEGGPWTVLGSRELRLLELLDCTFGPAAASAGGIAAIAQVRYGLQGYRVIGL